MIYDIWFQCVMGYGNPRAVKAIEHFGGSEKIFKATESERKNSGVFTERDLSRLTKVKLNSAEKILENCKKHSVTAVTYSSDKFPKVLKEIDSSPLVIYYRGTLPDFDLTPTVSVVGPRKVSDFGAKSAFSIARRLATGGFTIVSGGAHGADSKAHEGTLSAEGITVCVLPCGHDYDYLPEQRALRKRIEEKGCTLSEKPPLTPLGRAAFHIRNRLISGLSLCVVLVEAPKRSGGLITANYAIEQGKDVFVIPGNPTDKNYEGSNLLIKDGANVLLSAMDIFSEYSAQFPDKVSSEAAYKKTEEQTLKKTEKIILSALSKNAKMVYNNLNSQVFSLDDVYVKELTASEMISALTELEILGLIKTLPGGRYSKK